MVAAPSLPSSPDVVRAELDVAIVSPNRLMGEHWQSRHWRRRRERAAVVRALSGKRPPPGPWVVELTRVASRTLDDDNLAGSWKAPRDEIAAWLGVDDRSSEVTWVYAQAVERVELTPEQRRWAKGRALRVWARVTVESAAPGRGVLGQRCDAGQLVPSQCAR